VPKKYEPQPLERPGFDAAMIEGEGLGGFTRRVTVNDSAEELFRPRRYFKGCAKRLTDPCSLQPRADLMLYRFKLMANASIRQG